MSSSSNRLAVLAALAGLVLASTSARAQDVHAGDLVIVHPWTRATPHGAKVAGGYLTVMNHGSAPDTLLGGSVEAAARLTIHDMTSEGGVMRMRELPGLEVPPGGSVLLAPSGRHIMMTGLTRDLKPGETLSGTLRFARAGTVPVRFTVEGLGAKEPAHGHGPAMPGMPMQ